MTWADPFEEQGVEVNTGRLRRELHWFARSWKTRAEAVLGDWVTALVAGAVRKYIRHAFFTVHSECLACDVLQLQWFHQDSVILISDVDGSQITDVAKFTNGLFPQLDGMDTTADATTVNNFLHMYETVMAGDAIRDFRYPASRVPRPALDYVYAFNALFSSFTAGDVPRPAYEDDTPAAYLPFEPTLLPIQVDHPGAVDVLWCPSRPHPTPCKGALPLSYAVYNEECFVLVDTGKAEGLGILRHQTGEVFSVRERGRFLQRYGEEPCALTITDPAKQVYHLSLEEGAILHCLPVSESHTTEPFQEVAQEWVYNNVKFMGGGMCAVGIRGD